MKQHGDPDIWKWFLTALAASEWEKYGRAAASAAWWLSKQSTGQDKNIEVESRVTQHVQKQEMQEVPSSIVTDISDYLCEQEQNFRLKHSRCAQA